VAVPVAVSTPFTSATLVMFGIMLMLGGAGGVGTATASGSPLVIASTDTATKADIILFFILIIVPPLFDFRLSLKPPCWRFPRGKKRWGDRNWFPSVRKFT
jgi:hypothetical protein